MRLIGSMSLVLAAAMLVAASGAGGWSWPAGRAKPPVPRANPMSAAKAELGRRLFYDADLSADGSMACSTCHVQRHAFADSTRTHPGVHGDPGRRNAPALANVAWRRPLTWADPRLRTLEAQMLVPVTGETPVEMGMHGREAEIATRIGRDACYRQMFRAAFPERDGRIDMDTIAAALAAFQRTLVSDRSPWDRWRRGDRGALSAEQQEGARIFVRNCAACHSGDDLTDDHFHAIEIASKDRGLGEVSGRAADDGRFRTPSLRNVELTAPYLHDGSAATIDQAIARHAQGRLEARERGSVIAYLGALTDRAFVADTRYSLPDTACGLPL